MPSLGDHRAPRGDHSRFALQEVLAGLHQHSVGSTGEQPSNLLDVGIPQLGETDVSQRRQFGPRPYRSEHEARVLRFGEFVCDLTGQRGTNLGKFSDPVGDAVLREIGQVGAEGVRLHRVGTRLEVAPMHRTDDVRAGGVEDFIAAL
jgi:hypothetical protein